MAFRPFLLLVGSVLCVLPVRGQSAPGRVQPEEYLVLGTATRGSGEPMLAVDPKNPDNIVVVGMGSLHTLGPGQISRSMMNEFHATPDSTLPLLAVTHDGGRTWKTGVLPILHPPFARCPDPFALASASGVFYAGCEPRETTGLDPGGSYMLISMDHGDSWNPTPIPIITSFSQQRFAPGLKPRFGGVASPWDRPFLHIDESTGVIYGQAGGGQTDIDQQPGHYRLQSYITASTDGGRHFGSIYSWDNEQYPELGRGDFDAAHGAVAVVYTASKAPGARCPCAVFGLSHNQGRSFTYHVLSNFPVPKPRAGAGRGRGPTPGVYPGARGAGGMRILADPTRAGRFTLVRSELSRIDLAVSNDYGETWSPWVATAQVPGTQIAKPWISYSLQGQIALMWRAVRPDGSYEIWTAVSQGDHNQFSQPLRISAQPSPLRYASRDDGWFGDDIEDIVFGGDAVYMVWGDSRAGFLGTWFAQEPLAAYRF